MKKMIMAIVLTGILPAVTHASCYGLYKESLRSAENRPRNEDVAIGGTVIGGALGVTGYAAGVVGVAVTGGAAAVTGGVALGVTSTSRANQVNDIEAVLSLLQESYANEMGGLEVMKLQQELAAMEIDSQPTEIVSVIREIDGTGVICAETLLSREEVRDLVASRLSR